MTARYRAWQFSDPVLDRGAFGGGGLALNPSGGVAMVEEDDSVRQAILLLLSTVPGERVMRPGYGSHLHRLIFAPNDDTTAGLAIHYVRQALDRWEPRIDVLAIDAGPEPEEPEKLVIWVEYRVRASQAAEVLELALDLPGGGRIGPRTASARRREERR